MSQQYPGGLITKNPVVPSGPYQDSSASGVWTLDQASQYIKAGNWPTAGNLPNYIEDVFSTYLYTGNGSTQTITNGIDLSGKGGLVWFKKRSGIANNGLFSSADGFSQRLFSDLTNAYNTPSPALNFVPLTTGFSINSSNSTLNESGSTFASWTFREQAKFFDVVTFTGDGVDGRAISHSLGSVPGCILLKKTSSSDDWYVYHRSGGNGTNNGLGVLNSTAAFDTGSNAFGGPGSVSVAPTSTTFTIRSSLNANGATYVAYIFAHNAGGFGLSGTDNVISCGSYTGNGSATGPVVTLGYEPQWLLVKNATSTGDWNLIDNMRGFVVGGADAELNPNLSNAESTGTFVSPTATGFQINTTDAGYNTSSSTYIYIAIRRGPMKVPTSGTSVFAPAIGNNSGSAGGEIFTTNFAVDFFMRKERATTDYAPFAYSRLTAGKYLVTGTTAAEAADASTWFDTNTGIDYQYPSNFSGQIGWLFRRAPGFFDVVCWTGVAGTAQQISHNLAAVPELIITKRRDAVSGWPIYNKTITATNYLILQDGRASAAGSTFWNNTEPTSSVFTAGQTVSPTGGTIVAYLFATVAGVSKVGSYTGTGTTQVINCGFTAGSRFVMIKRTDSTGDWYVWDSARGIVAGNDPYLLLNSTAAEVTSTDYIDTAATGFEISSTAPAAINANGGTFIFLAIA